MGDDESVHIFQFLKSLGEFVEGEEAGGLDVADVPFVGVADIDEGDFFAAVEEGFEFGDGDFVGGTGRDAYATNGRNIFFAATDAAELFVIYEFFDGGIFAAEGAVVVAAEFEFAEFHGHGVEEEEAADEGFAFADDEFDAFVGLDVADDAADDTEDAASAQEGTRPGGGGSG